MLKSKKSKLIIASLCGLLSLSSCTIDGKLDQFGIIRPEFFGALFNINPFWFNLSFIGEVDEKAKNVTYTIDESKANYTTEDVLEDVIIYREDRYLGESTGVFIDTLSEQLFSFIYGGGTKEWCEEISKSSNYESSESFILKEDYVNTLKNDPNVNYMFKIKSTDASKNGKYVGCYIASNVNGQIDDYTDEGREWLYKKIENEQEKIAYLWNNMDEKAKNSYFSDQKRVFTSHYLSHGGIIGFDDCDLTKQNYTYLEMEEIHKPAVEIKNPYFYDLFEDASGNYNKSETEWLRYDTIPINDFISGNYLDIDCSVSSLIDKKWDGVLNGETVQLITKEDLLIEGCSFDENPKETRTYEDVKIYQQFNSCYRGGTIVIGEYHNFQTELLKTYNRHYYDSFYADWLAKNNRTIYDNWELHFNNAIDEVIEGEDGASFIHTTITARDETPMVFKKGTSILIRSCSALSNTKIKNFKLKFKVVKDVKF